MFIKKSVALIPDFVAGTTQLDVGVPQLVADARELPAQVPQQLALAP